VTQKARGGKENDEVFWHRPHRSYEDQWNDLTGLQDPEG